jgi:hypothetical protein
MSQELASASMMVSGQEEELQQLKDIKESFQVRKALEPSERI